MGAAAQGPSLSFTGEAAGASGEGEGGGEGGGAATYRLVGRVEGAYSIPPKAVFAVVQVGEKTEEKRTEWEPDA